MTISGVATVTTITDSGRPHHQRVALVPDGGEEIAARAHRYRHQIRVGVGAQVLGHRSGNRRHDQHGGDIVEERRHRHAHHPQ